MSGVFFYKEFNDHDLGDDESPLRKKFNTIIKDLEENNRTSRGDIKLIKGDGNIKYFRAKLSDSDRLLFTSIKHNNKDAFVILEVILNHDYQKSQFLTNKEKIKNIHIVNQSDKEISYNADEIDASQAHWFGKLITFSTTQEDIVKRAEECKLPLVVSGAAGSGKTSVALESLKKMQEKFEGGKILYITKSENLIKESKKLFEYEYYDETAGEFKIGAPEETEFLSLHEFLAKRAEDIKEKKPIDRNKFFSWFSGICKKDRFKEYAKDGDKIFEEFTAVIGGKGLGKEQYKKSGDRQAIFLQKEREDIYDLFEEYRRFIKQDSKYYDPSLIAYECTEKKNYGAVVVDEVQDLTESTLGLILRSLKDGSKRNFLLCGDVNQVVHPSFFSLSKLKSFLCQNKYIRNQESEAFYTLEKNYRNSEQVIELANRILHFKNCCFGPEDKITEDEKKTFFMKSDTENTGNVSLIAKDEEQKEIAAKMSGSTNWAILVLDDEKKEGARKLFDTPLVFNIHEAKGLEFENVILYKFVSCEAYNKIMKKVGGAIEKVRGSYQAGNVKTSQPKDKGDKSLEEYKFYMNALYVGVSRAIDGIYIMDDEEKCNLLKVIKPKKIVSVDIKKEESSPEEWRNKALELIDQGNVEQAKSIEKKLQDEGKKEYVEEITNALRAKEYRKEQAVSESKTEPQGSSIKVQVEKSEKHKGKESQNKKHLNEQKKLTKRELEENTKKLFSALDNGNLQLAERLIRQGINVKAKDQKNGDTPLHVAVYNGCKSVVALLLEHGANVDATSKDRDTPLHLAVDKGHEHVIQLLLEKKPNINATDGDGSTPLFIAAGRNYKCVVELLLKNGANVDDSNKNGYTPLHIAAQHGCEDATKLLLKKGASISATTNEKGYTPLHVAAQTGRERVVALLLQNKADVNTKDNENYTPLHDAAQNGSESVVQLLLDHGADINALTKGYVTPLLLALQHLNSKVLDLLLADPNINMGHVSYRPASVKNKIDYHKYDIKCKQDANLFEKVKEAANEKDTSKIDSLLKDIKDLLKPENKYGFKPSLNYSPGIDGVTTVEIVIKAGGKLLDLLYDYAEKNIGKDTEIFKQLKDAKEKIQPKSNLHDASISLKHFSQTRGS